ncbi:MAG: hypothetical protein ACP5M0_11855 [Desulfomonilaceae bacterium]
MKPRIALIVLITLVAAADALAQWGQPQAPENQPLPMYDTQYRGPMNVYGQPVFEPAPRQNNAQGQQTPNDGIIPMAASGLEAFGRYLWGYLPAPVRGEEPQILPPPGSGYVVRQVVPGMN